MAACALIVAWHFSFAIAIPTTNVRAGRGVRTCGASRPHIMPKPGLQTTYIVDGFRPIVSNTLMTMKTSAQLLLLLLGAVALPVSFASAVPKGAKKLPNSSLSKATGYWCGKISNKWIPGKKLSGGYFYSHAAERKNLLEQAQKASGKRKKKLTKQATQLKSFITSRGPTCADLSKSPLRFNLATASGVALQPSTSSAGLSALGKTSNLKRVDEDGSLSELLTSGDATFDRILVAPGNRLFVVFKTKTNISDTADSSSGCWVAEVNRATGVPTCVEDQFSPSWFAGDVSYHNPSIQFDQDGNPYYFGQYSTCCGPTGVNHQVLRKVVNAQKIDVVDVQSTANYSEVFKDFLVLQDGTVFYTGHVSGTLGYVRRLTPAGNSSDLWDFEANYITQFADGNIYIGRNVNFHAVQRYILSTSSVDPQHWISYALPGDANPPHQNAYPYCDGNTTDAFCQLYGSSIHGYVTTDSGKSLVSAGQSTTNVETSLGSLTQLHPTLAHPTTIVKRVFHMQKYGNKIILMGVDAGGKNVMTLYDTDDNSELAMITAQDDIEVYHAEHSSTGNTIIFDGQRKSDGKYVTGAFDLDTAKLSVKVIGNAALLDLAAFR